MSPKKKVNKKKDGSLRVKAVGGAVLASVAYCIHSCKAMQIYGVAPQPPKLFCWNSLQKETFLCINMRFSFVVFLLLLLFTLWLVFLVLCHIIIVNIYWLPLVVCKTKKKQRCKNLGLPYVWMRKRHLFWCSNAPFFQRSLAPSVWGKGTGGPSGHFVVPLLLWWCSGTVRPLLLSLIFCLVLSWKDYDLGGWETSPSFFLKRSKE